MRILLVDGALYHSACYNKTAAGGEKGSNHQQVRWIFVSVRVKEDETIRSGVPPCFDHRRT